ncbi:hypothetical protein AGMMS49965_19720 [Bacteroidia bacterium]|nr:hypothetical protein AGMMS49965_19720 [Bacteroidia bacterium]
MEKRVLIIDDEKEQANGLAKSLAALLPEYVFEAYSDEQEIETAIEERFYTLAIVDIRMDKYQFDGIDLVKKIIAVNPFSKVLIISAFKDEYFGKLKEILLSGKVVDILDKEPISKWAPQLKNVIEHYFDGLDKDSSEINNALLQFYADAKNETDKYRKGILFEHFISLLFQSIGYKDISKRTKDLSLNEVDLIIRNEIKDDFLNKFNKYILVECKNKPNDKVSKNDFIAFNTKLKHTNGMADLGIIATTGYIARTTYIEATRETHGEQKILFLSNPEIERLIKANDKLNEFKRIIDEQVKNT